jgi:hypothetical protein
MDFAAVEGFNWGRDLKQEFDCLALAAMAVQVAKPIPG